MVGEAVVHEAQFALLDVLFDGVELLFGRDLRQKSQLISESDDAVGERTGAAATETRRASLFVDLTA